MELENNAPSLSCLAFSRFKKFPFGITTGLRVEVGFDAITKRPQWPYCNGTVVDCSVSLFVCASFRVIVLTVVFVATFGVRWQQLSSSSQLSENANAIPHFLSSVGSYFSSRWKTQPHSPLLPSITTDRLKKPNLPLIKNSVSFLLNCREGVGSFSATHSFSHNLCTAFECRTPFSSRVIAAAESTVLLGGMLVTETSIWKGHTNLCTGESTMLCDLQLGQLGSLQVGGTYSSNAKSLSFLTYIALQL